MRPAHRTPSRPGLLLRRCERSWDVPTVNFWIAWCRLTLYSSLLNRRLHGATFGERRHRLRPRAVAARLGSTGRGPVPQASGRERARYNVLKDGYLTRDDFAFLYDACSAVLHSRNPFSARTAVKINYDFPVWVERIRSLRRAGAGRHSSHCRRGPGHAIGLFFGAGNGRQGLEVFDHEPAARLDCRRHPIERHVGVGQMLEDEAGVREIECPVGKWACDDVVASHLDVGKAKCLETPRVDVGGQYVTARAHTLRQPTGDRAQAAADLEARPPIRNARREKMTDDVRIVDIRECCEPLALSSGPG